MKYIVLLYLFCICCLTNAQLKTLWEPSSQTYPVCNLKPDCDTCDCTYFLAGIYEDAYGIKICYWDQNYTSYCIYRKDIQSIKYDYNRGRNDIAYVSFFNNTAECGVRFEIVHIPLSTLVYFNKVWVQFTDLEEE